MECWKIYQPALLIASLEIETTLVDIYQNLKNFLKKNNFFPPKFSQKKLFLSNEIFTKKNVPISFQILTNSSDGFHWITVVAIIDDLIMIVMIYNECDEYRPIPLFFVAINVVVKYVQS